jgi:predicted kinase
LNSDSQFLMVFSGPPGTGKTTVAEALAELSGMQHRLVHIQSDHLRHMIASPVYSRHESATVYAGLRALSHTFLKHGYSVVADATFAKIRHRRPFEALARRLKVRFLMVCFTCSLQTAMKRNSERTGWRFVPPERLTAIYNSFEYEPSLVVIDTERYNPTQAAEQVLSLLNPKLTA